MASAAALAQSQTPTTFEVGLTSTGRLLDAVEFPAGVANAPTVLAIASLDGNEFSQMNLVVSARRYQMRRPSQRPVRLLVIAQGGLKDAKLHFPPEGRAYRDNPESHSLWRWIGVHPPDLVLIFGEDRGLAEALSSNPVAGVGRIPARRLDSGANLLREISRPIPRSEASLAMDRRQARTPIQLARELGQVYGHNFSQLTYLPGMALLSQIRLGNTADVVRLSEPYLTGATESLGPRATSLNLAGHLVFASLAQHTADPRALSLTLRAADLGFEDGSPKESMPFHGEMSDSVFMGTAILTRAGHLTGDKKYFDMALRHVRFMNRLVRRRDGLYRHSPLDDAAWGRGNAFPALGLSLALSDLPDSHPAHRELLANFHELMTTLARFQTSDGMWREVIDYRGSYGETSATAMIAFAMERGVRRGWLPKEFYRHHIERAWEAVRARIASTGEILDVCESTNKQPSLVDYLRREALSGRDERGGGMVMLLATELAGLPD
jgi:rhamnogalacturonyl hydrolase YesR